MRISDWSSDVCSSDLDYPEDIRLKYRFLDLRRERLHANILLRSNVIASLRRRMVDQGFTEYQTPILTASSPEGARDYLVPSRVHPGKFYALPQAPQMFTRSDEHTSELKSLMRTSYAV